MDSPLLLIVKQHKNILTIKLHDAFVVTGLERCAGELINEIMSIIEDGDDDAELQLLLRGEPISH